MRIAIIGSGISGNVAAYHLHKAHDITVFEANDHIGGHTHTHAIETVAGETINVDTGFIVFNDWTYPNFIALLDELGVKSNATEMSFSVKCESSGLEYNGNTLNSLFAQRSNLISPRFYRMVRDILRFNREGHAFIKQTQVSQLSLGDFLEQGNYSDIFIRKYIVPMGAAIWSAKPEVMFSFPAQFFLRFFANHGLLSVNDRPQWRVIDGGSNSYVGPLIAGFKDNIRTSSPVQSIERLEGVSDGGVQISSEKYGTEHYDYVFIATHSDQALKLLAHPTAEERNVLGAIPYQDNQIILHTDTKVLPKRKLAWAAWNYHITQQEQERVAVTYDMNILQGFTTPETWCVTLNDSGTIDHSKIIKTLNYQHPIFTPAAVSAQSQQRAINGVQRTYYCGAYWRNGFHEDGVVSALNAVEHFKQDLQHA
ncbi:MAG: COG2907: Amine oxidase, flavin-containing [uncultured Thiotrichaceae bacterium]|uniref:COG2907: Amine oxidase, flavin-containing n=1 Tax=uncultured Thiotrichaceae bacterium TaxID=298394 RepID=A0A6S6TR99_9GAMM|nr:MAG: COG2907: Amine oxidase, flavin-containing [uncultured Thiotrichaceae bacterium]